LGRFDSSLRESLVSRLNHQGDIEALCSHAELDSNEYKMFDTARPPIGQRLKSSAVHAPVGESSSLPTVVEIGVPTSARPSPFATVEAGGKRELECRRPSALSRIAVVSCAGGSGASTIAANLARQLTFSGHSVLIDDCSRSRTVSYFFGTRPIQQNVLRTFMGDGGMRGALHLVFSSPEARADQVAGAIDVLRDELQWVIADCEIGQWTADADLLLAVCSPEPRSVMNAAALRRSLQAQQRQWPVFFLLNNFDSRNALHRRMRERLAAEAGRALLPFAVSKADELCEALSEQKTVLEFAPDAAVCGDFMRLAHWACNYFTSRDSRDREVA